MTLTNTVVAKLSVAFVAIAMALSLVAPAQAQTADELQTTIDSLMAQIAALNTQLGVSDTSASASVCPYTWTRSLSSGSTGADVMALQQFLNADTDTVVGLSGAGSPGMETDYYGAKTAAAVSNFQVKYRTDILSPVGLVNPTGYFGPSTMAKANALCVSAPVVVDDTDDTDDTMDDDSSDDDDAPVSLSGEASLDNFEIEDAEDDEVEEGSEDVEIALLTLEFADGDAEVSRIDVQLLGDGETDTDSVRPWDAFESISLWVDGEKIAEENADDEDDYLDEDDGTLRFTGIDLIAMEDEEVEVTVAATIQDNLDSEELTTWDVSVESLRFFDADDVATTETSGLDFGTDVNIEIVEAGSDDELIVKTSSSDPSASTLVLEDDSDSDWFSIFYFDLDTDDSVNDIELSEITVSVDVSSSTYNALVDDAELVIDGVTIDDVTVTGGTSASANLEFDVDGDVVIDAGDRVEVELRLQFNALNSGDEGTTVSAEVTSADADAIVAEGADDLAASQISGAASGEDHTMITAGIIVDVDSLEFSTDTSGENDTLGEFEITFDVTAEEGDFYITDTVTANSATEGAVFRLDGPATSTATTTGTLTSTADEDTDGVFTISEGETEEFTLRVTADVETAGDYRVRIMSLYYTSNSDGTTDTSARTLSPASDYRTGYETIQAN